MPDPALRQRRDPALSTPAEQPSQMMGIFKPIKKCGVHLNFWVNSSQEIKSPRMGRHGEHTRCPRTPTLASLSIPTFCDQPAKDRCCRELPLSAKQTESPRSLLEQDLSPSVSLGAALLELRSAERTGRPKRSAQAFSPRHRTGREYAGTAWSTCYDTF